MRTPRLLAAIAATAMAGGLAVIPAANAAAPKPKILTRHLVAPLSLAVDGRQVLVTQNFAGSLDLLRPGRSPKTLYRSTTGNEVGGVSVRKGHIVFTETASDAEGNPSHSWVKKLTKKGKVKRIASVRAYENAHNPDGDITYGFTDLDEACAAQWPVDQFGPVTYTGIRDSHPYATYQTKKTVYVADAGMNAVLAITKGRIRTVAVTPAVEVQITQDIATAMGAPDCVVGHTYYGESVPTDVQRGRDGRLYVTTEGGGLGEQMPLGSVYRINPRTGASSQVVGQLMAPTGVAVTPRGDLLVAQLFGNQISLIKKGTTKVKPFAMVGLPGAVEVSGRHVYATTNVLPPETGAPDGKVVRFGH